MIRCCIFDLDGTILDTITTITYYVNFILERHGIEPVSEGECNYFAGDGSRMLISRALGSKGICDEELKEIMFKGYVEKYEKAPFLKTSVFDGILECLAELKSMGIKLAVLSNKPDTALKSVVKNFFGDIFDDVVGAVDSIPLKPNPQSAINMLRRLNVCADEVAWIGDTATDIETAKNLGAALSIGVLWGFRERGELEGAGADKIVSHPREIVREVALLG